MERQERKLETNTGLAREMERQERKLETVTFAVG
jgi:hypothetical protein